MKAKDFKQLSLNQLRGKYGSVLLALFLAMLVTGAVSAIVNIPSTLSDTPLIDSAGGLNLSQLPVFVPLGVIGGIILLAVSGAISYGVSKYMLTFVRQGSADLGYIFCGFSNGFGTFLRTFVLALLMDIFVFLWSLLFIIPGIIASYRYALAYYIMADDDSISAIDAIRKSTQMMIGHKWKLFCLQLSFIGWYVLCTITCGIGFIFLAPYLDAATTNFYEYLRGISEGSKAA
ncbi:MAG TPA: DUF975 family protein [Candidatus Monoglobus merdigallinarum]|uniref:DUF975 family protein n=1 Tax=Candidatus Monoglobus merdigallinarum TaxID=2838698 RepID=A0A9D1TL83_9FIRM|nr:DUF975 family protein [Candidatus Monoglobus merdigallinarum]